MNYKKKSEKLRNKLRKCILLKIQKLKITHGKTFYSQKCFTLKTYVLKVEKKKKKKNSNRKRRSRSSDPTSFRFFSANVGSSILNLRCLLLKLIQVLCEAFHQGKYLVLELTEFSKSFQGIFCQTCNRKLTNKIMLWHAVAKKMYIKYYIMN